MICFNGNSSYFYCFPLAAAQGAKAGFFMYKSRNQKKKGKNLGLSAFKSAGRYKA
jgi:hypothetical protein